MSYNYLFLNISECWTNLSICWLIPTLWWFLILSIQCWTQLACTKLRIFASMFMTLVCSFIFLRYFYLVLVAMSCDFIKQFGNVSSYSIPGKNCIDWCYFFCKCFVKITIVAIWAWGFNFVYPTTYLPSYLSSGKTFNYTFSFF